MAEQRSARRDRSTGGPMATSIGEKGHSTTRGRGGAVATLVISADCHAGPSRMDAFRPYLESRWLDDFDEYLACIDEYERRSTPDAASARSRAASGGAPRP